MSATVLTLDAAKKANIGVVEDGRGGAAVHDLITAYRANRRSGTACAKTRGEVSATGKKPYRQKGTGRARAGGNASPVQRGGGVVFGPRPRDYSKKVLKAVRRLAFRKALSERILAGDVVTVKDFAVPDGKTKSFISQVAAAVEAPRILIVNTEFGEETYLAGRNVAFVLMMTAEELNAEHLLYFDKIILTASAIEALAQRTSA